MVFSLLNAQHGAVSAWSVPSSVKALLHAPHINLLGDLLYPLLQQVRQIGRLKELLTLPLTPASFAQVADEMMALLRTLSACGGASPFLHLVTLAVCH